MFSGLINLDYYRLKNWEFIENLRLRLLVPTFIHRTPTVCFEDSCKLNGIPKNIANDPFHALTCKGNSNARHYRHNQIRNETVKICKICKPNAQILTEQVVGNNSDGSPRRTDIVITEETKFVHLDVTIWCPTSNIAIEKGSTTTPLATAIHAETVKSKLYSELPPIIGATLIPFALESTGALSPAALKFIKSLSVPEDSPDALFYFMGNINRIIARSQAAMMQRARNNGASHGAF
jgi:hypothetical protein